MLEDFFGYVAPSLRERSGRVFYSGRSSFLGQRDLYFLGLNPGGLPTKQEAETIASDIQHAIQGREHWSAYQDESWRGKEPGTHGMQPRVLHLIKSLGHDPRSVPASNVVFVRSSREADLELEKRSLLEVCWPVHRVVMAELGTRALICFGGTAGRWVRDAIGADRLVGTFVETNKRQWKSYAHRAGNGRVVFTLTHPSIAKWDSAATDPSDFVTKILA